MPHFSNLVAAEKYHRAALLLTRLLELSDAAWANKRAEVGSSALLHD